MYAPLLGVAVGGDVAVVETDDEEEDEDEDTGPDDVPGSTVWIVPVGTGLIHLVVIKPGTTVPRLVDTVEVLV